MSKRTVDADLLDRLNRKMSIVAAVIEGACTEVSSTRIADGLQFSYQELSDTMTELNNTE